MIDEFFKTESKEVESSWCETCLKRNTCDIKEEVALEEASTRLIRQHHLNVSVECAEYERDINVVSLKEQVESWGKRK